MKWIVKSGVNGYWLGSYESEKQEALVEAVRKGSVFYDIGGHVGFFTMLASVLVGPEGRVVAFEPFSRNIYFLKEHIYLNRCDNVQAIEAAVAEKSGTCFFKNSDDTYTGSLSTQGNLEVKVVCLDDLVLKEGMPLPNYLKIDVEGAEFLVLSGAKQILLNHHPVIFLSTHNKEAHQQCCDFLIAIGYKLKPLVKSLSLEDTDEVVAEA